MADLLLSRLCISPQCGFASVAEGNPITEEVGRCTVIWMRRPLTPEQEQRRKLALVLEAARGILE